MTDDESGLPPELQELADEMRAARDAKIEAIGKEVAKKRDEAVKGRKESGIELIWEQDEEYYQGIDDANRESLGLLKGSTSSGGLSREKPSPTTRCTSFFNITRQFVESAAARMGDILLPAGDWNFAVKASPVQDAPNPAFAGSAPIPGNLPGLGGPDAADSAVQTDVEQDQDPRQKEAEKKAKRGEVWIQDALVECRYHSEVRKVIEDAAKIGTGILKGPFPQKKTSRKGMLKDGKYVVELVTKTNPASKHVDPWDFFPDPTCGDDIHNGSYTLERDRFSAKQLRDLKGTKGYLSDQIDKVLDEGPCMRNYADDHRISGQNTADDDKYEIWYFYGLVDAVALTAMNVKLTDEESHRDLVPAVVVLVNETPIKAFINPLDTGEFPYDVMPWQRQAGTWTGIGVARQGRTPQDMLNAAGRAMMDNAGLSSGPMLIIRRKGIEPADGKWEVTARKVWWDMTDGVTDGPTNPPFQAINIPMMQVELNGIMDRAYKMMEDATGISFLLMGQQGSAPDTVGGMELLHRNSSALLRRLARVFDELVTERHIGRYYVWLLLNGPDEAKGDMNIEAIGSTALVEREIQAMEAMALLQLSLNPAYGLDPEKAMTEVLKTKRFIPEKWQMDAEKKKNLAPPMIPAIEVAKIRAEVDGKRLALEQDKTVAANTLRKHEIDVDTDRDTEYNRSLAERDQVQAQIRIQELEIKRDLAMLDYANKRDISLDKIKSELAKESMRLRTQKELAGVTQEADQVARTTMEPAGRAADGRAFQE